MGSLSKTRWLLAIAAACITVETTASCPRCISIEKQRSLDQSKEIQSMEYYDNQTTTSSKNLNIAENSNFNNLSALPKGLDVFEENDVNLPVYNHEEQDALNKTALNQATGKDTPPIRLSQNNNNFSTILNFFQMRHLIDTLSGPFTLFIPTNKAILELPPAFLHDLLKPENAERLNALVSNHVVPHQILKSDFSKHQNREIKSISGRNLTLNVDQGQLTIDNVQILGMESSGKEGVIYLIDRVLVDLHQTE